MSQLSEQINDSVNRPKHYTDDIKFCGCCKQTLPIYQFAKNKVKKDGLQERCKNCRAMHHQKTKHLRPKVSKEKKKQYLLASYGLSLQDFNQMLEKQGGACAICHSFEWGRPSPSVDHCHSTNKVRGLLCNNCNRALGLFKDNVKVLQNAVQYLQ